MTRDHRSTPIDEADAPMLVPIVSNDAAQAIVLSMMRQENPGEPFAVASSDLSPHGDCWVICANHADYVLKGDFSMCYVGVCVYLVDTQTGRMSIVGSAESPEDLLQRRYDLRLANGKHYVLLADFDRSDKAAVMQLRRGLECPYARASELAGDQPWLTGVRQDLLTAQDLFRQQQISTVMALMVDPERARPLHKGLSTWDQLKQLMQ